MKEMLTVISEHFVNCHDHGPRIPFDLPPMPDPGMRPSLVLLLAAPASCLVVNHARSMQHRLRAAPATMDVEKRRAELASGSLDPSTFWRLALNLHPPNKPDGEGVELTVTLRFMQEAGYEPPQVRT